MRWTTKERRILAGLRTPAHIQQFLDHLAYDERAGAASPRAVMHDGKANCFSGVLLACAALREIGYPPRLAYIDAAYDDGHCLAEAERYASLFESEAKLDVFRLRE